MTREAPEGARAGRLRALFDLVCDLEPAVRAPRLKEQCRDDPGLAEEVMELLALATGTGTLSSVEGAPLAEALALAVPQRIGCYQPLRVLGHGGMGVVYLARHVTSGARVALKTVNVPDAKLVQGIRREIHALARIRHPGVVRIVEEGVHEGIPWYAMELFTGTTLRRHASGLAAGALRERLTLVRRLCGPLAYLHGEGIVHRDLKPDNVLVDDAGWPILLDFGLVARFFQGPSREPLEVAVAAGTAAYMAPEQARGELTDARADLYALGCILAEMVGGKLPWRREAAAIAPELAELIDRLTAPDPRNRMGHALDVAAALACLGADDEALPGPTPRAYLYRPSLAGRRDALDGISRRLDLARRGSGSFIFVEGESGAGKTRLLLAAAELARGAGLPVVTSECLPSVSALRPIVAAIADGCRGADSATSRRILGRGGRALAQIEPAIAGLADDAGLPALPELDPRYARARLFGAILFSLDALGRGLLLLIDDLQWADDLTLELLGFALRSGFLDRAPLVVLGAYRPEEAGALFSAICGAPSSELFKLPRLTDGEVGAMVADMLSLPATPPPLVGFLARQSEGNPFFVAEYLRAAVTEGVLGRDRAGRWQVTGDGLSLEIAPWEHLPLPGAIREIVARRLEGLTPPARRLLDAASVVGREVDVDILPSIAALSEEETMDSLDLLVAHQILEEAPRLRFLHDKIREVVYAQLPDRDRSALHRACAIALEGVASAAELAHHWEQGGDPRKASEQSLRAAREAVGGHLLGEAARLYQKAIALGCLTRPERAAVGYEIASNVLLPAGRTREAAAELEEVLRSSAELGDDRLRGQVLRAFANACRMLGQMGRAKANYQEALSMARSRGDVSEEASVLGNIASVLQDQGRNVEARSFFEEALSLSRATGQRATEALLLSNVCSDHVGRGDWAEALGVARRILELYRDLGDRRRVAVALTNLAIVFLGAGRDAEAGPVLGEALALAREVSDQRSEGEILCHLAGSQLRSGRTEEAYRTYESALALHRETGDRRFEGVTLGNMGSVMGELGRHDEARALLLRGLAIRSEIGDRRGEALCFENLASLALATTGSAAEADAFEARAEASLREIGNDRELSSCLCRRGRNAIALGRSGRPFLDEAQVLARKGRSVPQALVALLDGLAAAVEAAERPGRESS